ncbi:hypothetical protein BC936DRAFT_138971 [Jimgerdemannia flammicorona]|uniref:Rad51-like C-terminal domain-containing protein n=1 Tax=Jimgerdemannia flammicorona TaxID=994334 RepID=A0A433BBW1_9FUNG|nr:hypothetical protein BC936DRAFT_138971 [Jimgerdemannia flammicorona]
MPPLRSIAADLDPLLAFHKDTIAQLDAIGIKSVLSLNPYLVTQDKSLLLAADNYITSNTKLSLQTYLGALANLVFTRRPSAPSATTSSTNQCLRCVELINEEKGKRCKQLILNINCSPLFILPPSIDSLLDGGMLTGEITELAGPSASGKTQLAFFTIATTLAADPTAAVLYIDTCNTFEPARVRDLLARAGRFEEARKGGMVRSIAFILKWGGWEDPHPSRQTLNIFPPSSSPRTRPPSPSGSHHGPLPHPPREMLRCACCPRSDRGREIRNPRRRDKGEPFAFLGFMLPSAFLMIYPFPAPITPTARRRPLPRKPSPRGRRLGFCRPVDLADRHAESGHYNARLSRSSPLLPPSTKGHALMTTFARSLRSLATAHHIAILVVTSSVSSTPSFPLSAFAATNTKPGLGASWTFLTDVQLYLSRPTARDESEGGGERVCEVVRARRVATGRWCVFYVVSVCWDPPSLDLPLRRFVTHDLRFLFSFPITLNRRRPRSSRLDQRRFSGLPCRCGPVGEGWSDPICNLGMGTD